MKYNGENIFFQELLKVVPVTNTSCTNLDQFILSQQCTLSQNPQ